MTFLKYRLNWIRLQGIDLKYYPKIGRSFGARRRRLTVVCHATSVHTEQLSGRDLFSMIRFSIIPQNEDNCEEFAKEKKKSPF